MEWDRVIGLGCLFGWFISGCIAMYSGSVLNILLWWFGQKYEAKIVKKDSHTSNDVDSSPSTSYWFKVQYIKEDKYMVDTIIHVDSEEYLKYKTNSNVEIGYLSCFPCITRLKSGKSLAKICGCKDDGEKILENICIHFLTLGWFAIWIFFSYASVTSPGYIGVFISMGWSIICWMCCCCPAWIYCSPKSSEQSYTMASEETENQDPENPVETEKTEPQKTKNEH